MECFSILSRELFLKKGIYMEINELAELDNLEKKIGTPSAQKIIPTLACWENLSAQQLSSITELSESQVHATLQNLIEIEIVVRESRGIYSLSSNSFTQSLKNAYIEKIERVLGKFMYNLSNSLESTEPDEVAEKISYMMERWKPMMERLYRTKLSSLAEYLIDKF
jgi:predicted transcriptional regulator